MKCPSCSEENREGRKFCTGCGAQMAVLCTACQALNEPGDAYCGECGAPLQVGTAEPTPGERNPRAYTPKHLADQILQTRSALEGERKQVTVLFADVKGSMELADQAGPEAWHAILDRFFAILSEGVHRYEGTVNQFTGDGIMALFGAPIAHEDHAHRGCYAALHIRDALQPFADELRRSEGLNLSVRIGLNSGEVVVGKIGDDLRMDYTAQGHTVGLAQRLEQLAAPNSAYLSAHTARLVEGYLALRDLGEFPFKGTSAPLRVYELEGVGALRTRLDSSRARGFSTFVGREPEMASLESALQAAIAGNGRVVGVVADAGIGKSRLCHEFVARCRARGIRVNEAHCPAHGKTVPYLPLLEMLRDIFGIEARDSDQEARRKITDELELMVLDASLRSLLPLVFEFMGVADPSTPPPPMSPEERRRRLLAFVRHLAEARSAREPTVLLLDDAHWIDPGSDAFLAHVVAGAANSSTLWLVNFRPEYRADWMGSSFYQQLPLRPLAPEGSAALLADLFGTDSSVAALPALIEARTGGNPFFIEELGQSLIENGSLVGTKGAYQLVRAVDGLDLPATVQSVLAARLDRLGEREKHLLQTAAVIGQEFTGALLRTVVTSAGRNALSEADVAEGLAELRRAEFVFETALYPEVEYSFRHPLTQEVAYGSQLAVQRAEQHATVAEAIERLDANKLDERAALLAYHWEQAGVALTAAQWHARAARVAGFDSQVQALFHWEKVWEILRPESSSEDAVALRLQAAAHLLNFAWRLGGMSDERVARLFAEGKALAVTRADEREQVRLHYAVGLNFMMNGSPRRAISLYEEGLAIAEASGEPELRWTIGEPFEWALWAVGDLASALRMNDAQIALSEIDPRLGMNMVGFSTANSFLHRGLFLGDAGRFDEAADALRCGVERARDFGENELISWADLCWTLVIAQAGDVNAGLAMARRSIEFSERSGSVFLQIHAHGSHGLGLLLHGEWEAARQSLSLAVETGRTNQVGRVFEPRYLAGLAEAYLNLGEPRRALALADEAIETAVGMETPVGEVCGHLARARVLLTLGEAHEQTVIEATLDRALAIVRSTGARAYEPQILVEQAKLAGLRKDAPGRETLLEQARTLFAEMGATGHADRVAQYLAEGRR